MPACALGLAYHAIGFTWIHRVCQSFRCHSQNVKDGKWKSGLGMSCRGILCLLGVRKMALELQSEVVELHEDPGKIRARLGDARAGTGARGHPVSDQDGIQHLHRYRQLQRGAKP